MKNLFCSFLFILLISSNSYAELDTNIQNREYNKFTTDSSGNTAIRIILPDGGGGGSGDGGWTDDGTVVRLTTSTDNVGIGTSTPAQNLEIAGNLKISNTVNNTTTPLINAVLTSSTLENGSTFTGTDSTMSTTYIGTKFTASASATLKDLSFRIKASGSMTGDYGVMQAFIYADDGGSPSKPTGSALANFAQVAYNSISTSYAIIGMGNASTSYALVSGTTYWLVIKQVNAPSTNNVVFDSIAGSNYGVTSSDGSTWTNTNNRLRFLIYGASYIGTYSSSQTKYGVYGTSSTYYGGYFHSDNYDGLYADSTNGVGASFHSNTSHGIKSTSENSNGIYGISNGSAGVRGDSTTSYGLLAIPTHAVTNSVINTLGLRAQSSGTTTAGFGNGIEFQSENGSNSNKIVMQLAAVYQDVTSGSEDADFDVRLMAGGSSAASKFMVKSNGRVGIGTTAPTEALHVVGNITMTGQIVSTKTTDIGWSVVAAANQACNTTCTNACVMGFASAATGSDPVLCTDASADNCLCAGSN